MRTLTILALVALVGCSDRSAQSVDPRIADASRPLVFITNPMEPPTSYTNAAAGRGGLDILIVKKTMSPVTYRRRNGKNILTIGKDYGD